MLQNCTDDDIKDELLTTGYLYLPVLGEDAERIEKKAVEYRHGGYAHSVYVHSYTAKGSGERQTPSYRQLLTLLFCEYITFDEIRANWKYHGVLLGNPRFCEKLVHDQGCACVLCVPGQ